MNNKEINQLFSNDTYSNVSNFNSSEYKESPKFGFNVKQTLQKARNESAKEKTLYNAINNAVKNNIYGTDKFNLSKQKTSTGRNAMTNHIFTELMNIKDEIGEADFDKRLNYNPVGLIAKAVKKATSRNKAQETQLAYAIDDETHTRIKDGNGDFVKIKPSGDYMSGKRFYNNIIKENGLSKEFMRKANIGIYGKRNNGKLDAISIKFENFKQGIKSFDYPIGKGKTASATLHKYKGKYGDVYIVDEESTGGVLLFKSIFEIKAYYGIEKL